MIKRPHPRALLLSPVLPSDRGNGLAMRSGLWLTGLSEVFAVDVIVPPAPPPDAAGAAFTADLAARIEILAAAPAPDVVADAVKLLRTPSARARAEAVRPLPELCRGAPSAWAAAVALRAAGAELIVAFRAYLAPLLDEVLDQAERPGIVIDVDDIDSETERRLGRPEQATRLEALERYYLSRADHVIACSPADACRLAERDGLAAVTAIPNALRPPVRVAPAGVRYDLVFVGNLSYAPNVEAARWLCESVLPLLGDVQAAIVGSRPGAAVLALAQDDRVTVIGDVEDVTPWYAGARVAVVPVQAGGGSRFKLIEALAHGRPVVSTTVGGEGQPWGAASEAAGVVIADTPEAFATACRELLSDPERARMLGDRGRSIVRERTSVTVVAPRLARVGLEAVRRRAARAGRVGRSGSERPLLTAALIVRDEEAVLGPCLDSLTGLADEIVIVDTGSADATRSIARAHGAEVLDHPWTGDFAAPRNLGLDHARAAWVLYIDADERVAPLDRDELSAHLATSSAMGLRVLLRPTVHATPYFEYRLWRNDPRVRFRGVMHERVADAIHAAANEDGRIVETWPGLLLEHVGYEGDQTAKHIRNLPLLEGQLRRDPGNIYNWRHLAQVLEALGRGAEGRDALERAVALAVAEPTPSVDGGLAWAELVRARHEEGIDASELLAVGRERWPEHWLIRWMEGIIALETGRLADAERCFRSLLDVDIATLPERGIAYDARIFGEWAHASLGLALFRGGRYTEAAAAYAAAERCAPQEAEHRVKRMLAEARAHS